ncbi:MAG: hypothetical protein J6C97_03050 [Clostridia bacterium]|nr:hypothetical protein [Clostridia bacterium]
MQTEITVKVFNDLDFIIKKLTSLNYTLQEKVFMQDWYFSKNTLEELNNFDYPTLIKNSFIVRNVIDSENKTFLCYKNKVLDDFGNVIKEEKTSVEVSNLENVLKILNSCKLTNWCYLKQDMYIFSKGEICFAVQVVEDLGIFIEYEETKCIQNLSEKEKIEKMYNDLKELGLRLDTDYSSKKVYLKFKRNS